MSWVLYVLIGFAAGIISGLGIGGGAILIPAVTVIFGLQQQQAQNVNLIYFIPTAAIALISHIKSGNIEKSVLKGLALYGILGAVTGSVIAINMKPDMLKRFFGIFLLIIGISEFLKKAENKA